MARNHARSAALYLILLVLPAALLYSLRVLGDDETVWDAEFDVLEAPRSAPRDEGDHGAGGETRALTSTRLEGARGGLGNEADTPSLPSPTYLEGRVLDEFGQGLAAVEVTLSLASGQARSRSSLLAQGETDATGAFRFESVPAGRLCVQAEAMDLAPAWAVDVMAGTWVELRLSPAARLEVVVRGPDETFVRGATVTARRSGFRRSETTDARGRARFDRLPVGAVEVFVRGEDSAAAPRLLHLTAAEPARLTCTLAASRLLKGRVLGQGDKQPLKDATVTLRALDTLLASEATCRTDGDGSFELRNPYGPAERATLVVTKDGYAEGRAPLARGEAPAGLELTLRRQRLLKGQVVDADGHAVSGVRLAWATALPETQAVISDGHGGFSIPLPPAPSGATLFALVGRGAGGRFGAAAVRLPSDPRPLRVVLRGTGRLQGDVLNRAGRPVPGALVSLTSSGEFVAGLAADADEAWARQRGLEALSDNVRVVSDARGRYALPAVPAGAWSVRLVHGSSDLRQREPLALTAGAELSLDFTIGETAPLLGRVLDDRGRPVAGARVLLAPSGRDEAGYAATSAPDGRFRFDAVGADRPYTLSASAPGLGSARLEEVFADERSLDIPLGVPVRFEGRVEFEGAPYPGRVDVWLVPGATRRGEDASAGAVPVPALRYSATRSQAHSARFSLSPPYAGAWLLCAGTSDGGLTAEPLAVGSSADGGHEDLLLALRPAATLQGATQPLAVVSVHAWSGREAVARPLASVKVGPGGRFEFRGLPEGALQIRVVAAGGAVVLKEALLFPGTSTQLDVPLQR